MVTQGFDEDLMELAIELVGTPVVIQLGYIEGRLTIATAHGSPESWRLHPIDEERDILYRTPRPVTCDELRNELQLHIPRGWKKTGVWASFSTGQTVLHQRVTSGNRVLSPLSAVARIIRLLPFRQALCAERETLLLLQEDAEEITCNYLPFSFLEFAVLAESERRKHLPSLAPFVVFGSDITIASLMALQSSSSEIRFRRFDSDLLRDLVGPTAFVDAQMEGMEHAYAFPVAAGMIALARQISPAK